MVKNGVIINGATYEFVPRKIHGNDCKECALKQKCHRMAGDLLCAILFDDYINKTFKRVEK